MPSSAFPFLSSTISQTAPTLAQIVPSTNALPLLCDVHSRLVASASCRRKFRPPKTLQEKETRPACVLLAVGHARQLSSLPSRCAVSPQGRLPPRQTTP